MKFKYFIGLALSISSIMLINAIDLVLFNETGQKIGIAYFHEGYLYTFDIEPNKNHFITDSKELDIWIKHPDPKKDKLTEIDLTEAENMEKKEELSKKGFSAGIIIEKNKGADKEENPYKISTTRTK